MREIHVDPSFVKGKHDKFFKECASTGRAYLILRSDHQQHLTKAAQECGFKYLRFHGLFQDDMGVYREDKNGNPIYSWQYVDAVYDFVLSIGMRPFVVFDFMPEKLASGETTVYWEKANVTPPKDYSKWSNLIYEVVNHFAERYGYEEVKQWFFEVWNEPDNGYFFTTDMFEYFKLYESSAQAVKLVCQDFKVGGPAVAGDVKWISGLIEHCHKSNIPLDFVSTHNYSTKNFSENGKKEKNHQQLEKTTGIPVWNPGTPWPLGNQCYDREGLADAVNIACKAVKESKRPDLEIYFTEWGLTWDYWDPLRDSYQAASFILSRLKGIQHHVKAMSYCEISDVFEEDGPPTSHFHGGFGLVNLQGIRKPAYFAYQYLNQLGEVELRCDDQNTIACSDDEGVQVLFWDCAVRQNCENKEYYNQDNPPLAAEKVKLSFSGLKPGNYELSLQCTGYRKNDAYTTYMEMTQKGSLSREQVMQLDAGSSGLPIKTIKITIEENSMDFEGLEISMNENDVYLATLKQL